MYASRWLSPASAMLGASRGNKAMHGMAVAGEDQTPPGSASRAAQSEIDRQGGGMAVAGGVQCLPFLERAGKFWPCRLCPLLAEASHQKGGLAGHIGRLFAMDCKTDGRGIYGGETGNVYKSPLLAKASDGDDVSKLMNQAMHGIRVAGVGQAP